MAEGKDILIEYYEGKIKELDDKIKNLQSYIQGLNITYNKLEEKEVNSFLDNIIYDTTGIDENYMQMELDVIGPAYFTQKKTYVTLKHNIIHLMNVETNLLLHYYDI